MSKTIEEKCEYMAKSTAFPGIEDPSFFTEGLEEVHNLHESVYDLYILSLTSDCLKLGYTPEQIDNLFDNGVEHVENQIKLIKKGC